MSKNYIPWVPTEEETVRAYFRRYCLSYPSGRRHCSYVRVYVNEHHEIKYDPLIQEYSDAWPHHQVRHSASREFYRFLMGVYSEWRHVELSWHTMRTNFEQMEREFWADSAHQNLRQLEARRKEVQAELKEWDEQIVKAKQFIHTFIQHK